MGLWASGCREDWRASGARGCTVKDGARLVGDAKRGERGTFPLPSELVEGLAGLCARGEDVMERLDGVRERLPVR